MRKALIVAAAILFPLLLTAGSFWNQALESMTLTGVLNIAQVNHMPSPAGNLIVNGSMDFDQQLAAAGTAYNLTTNAWNDAAAHPTLDGWNIKWNCAASCASNITFARATASPPPGFSSYLLATVTTGSATVAAGDYLFVFQPIEALNLGSLGFGATTANNICLSFWAMSTTVADAIVTGAIQNAATNRSYVFDFVTNHTPGTWMNYAVCPPGDTTGTWPINVTTEGMRVVFTLESGSTFQGTVWAIASGSSTRNNIGHGIFARNNAAWTGTNVIGLNGQTQLTKTSGATLAITGVQLEQSWYPNPFMRMTQAREADQVQRYAWRLAEPAANINVGSCNATAAGAQTCQIALPTTMRAAPTCTITTGTFKELIAGAATTWVPTAGTNTANVATITSTAAGGAAGQMAALQGGGGSGVVFCSSRL